MNKTHKKMPAILVPILEREQKTAFFAHFIVFLTIIYTTAAAGANNADKLPGYYEEYRDMPSEKLYDVAAKLYKSQRLDRAAACYHIIANRYDERMSPEEKQLCTLSLNREGVIAFIRADYTKAYQLFSRAMTQADDSCRNECLNNLAVIYILFRDYGRAREYLEQSFDLSVKQKAWFDLLATLHNLLYLDFVTEHYGASASRVAVFRNLTMPHDGHYKYSVHLCNGMDYLAAGHYSQAIGELTEALDKSEGLLQSDRLKGDLYTYIAQAHFLMGDESGGMNILEKCEQHATEHDLRDIVLDIYWLQVRHYEVTGNQALARESRYKYMEIKDSLFNASEYGKIKDMLFYNELEKHERQIIRYDVERKMRTRVIAVIGVALMLTLALLIMSIVQNRRLHERNKNLYKKNVEYLNAMEQERILRNEMKGYRSNLSEVRRTELLERIQAVLDDVEIVCTADFTLERLSALVDSNAKYVSQVINETLGKSFTSLLNECRINEVCKRLADDEQYGQLSIEAIAESVGYRSRSHFANNFRAITGLTPSQYRRIAKQNRVL